MLKWLSLVSGERLDSKARDMTKHVKERVDFSIKREKVLTEESDEVRRMSPN